MTFTARQPAQPASQPLPASPPISPSTAPVGSSLHHRYHHLVRRRWWLLAALAAVLATSVALDVALGPSSFALSDVLRGLWAPQSLPPAQQVILWDHVLQIYKFKLSTIFCFFYQHLYHPSLLYRILFLNSRISNEKKGHLLVTFFDRLKGPLCGPFLYGS